MKRIRRGWALTKKSWALLNSHRELVRFPLFGGIATIILGLVFLGPGAFALDQHSYGIGVPLIVIGIYVLSVVGIYFSVGLAACADRIFRGISSGVGVIIIAHDNVYKRLSVDQNNLLGKTPALSKVGLPIVTYNDRIVYHLNGDIQTHLGSSPSALQWIVESVDDGLTWRGTTLMADGPRDGRARPRRPARPVRREGVADADGE